MRLIDGDALMGMVFNDVVLINGDVKGAGLILADAVEKAPTVDAEVVVYCKDCKHYGMGVCLKIYSDGNVHSAAWQMRKPEDFCSYGERKDGEDAKG